MTEDFFMRLCDVYGFAPSRALRELVDAAIGQAVVAERYKAARLAEPVQQGCEHCNQPLYAAVKCRVCGRVTSAEPVQESAICDECGKSKHDGWALYCVKCVEPMFAPPQRKPLTEEEIRDLLEAEFLGRDGKRSWDDDLQVFRLAERTHKIGGEA